MLASALAVSKEATPYCYCHLWTKDVLPDKGRGVEKFCADFQAAFPGWTMASGLDDEEFGTGQSHRLWAVKQSLLAISAEESKTTYFAPSPLYNSLQTDDWVMDQYDWSTASIVPPAADSSPSKHHESNTNVDTYAKNAFQAFEP